MSLLGTFQPTATRMALLREAAARRRYVGRCALAWKYAPPGPQQDTAYINVNIALEAYGRALAALR